MGNNAKTRGSACLQPCFASCADLYQSSPVPQVSLQPPEALLGLEKPKLWRFEAPETQA